MPRFYVTQHMTLVTFQTLSNKYRGTTLPCISVTHLSQVYEAAMSKLLHEGATPQEVATVSRLQPDMSVHVKALTGLGRVQTLGMESLRLLLTKVRLPGVFASERDRDPLRRHAQYQNLGKQAFSLADSNN